PDADVVEGDDAALRRKCVDQCGVPVVEVAAEVLQQHDRDVASTEVAIGVVDPILRRDPLYGGLGVLHVCGRRCHRERSFQVAASCPELANRVADRDDAVRKDACVKATAVDEVLDQARPDHRLQVQAWLAELDAVTLDLTDLEALADQAVEPYAA